MHYVSKVDYGGASTPRGYKNYSVGFHRTTYVDRMVGSVHMGTGISMLDAYGSIAPHVHSFEETFYILKGQVIVQIGNQAYLLGPGHFGLIRTGTIHSWRSAGDEQVRWLEMQSPQPRTPDYGIDTYFAGGDAPTNAAPPALNESANRVIGHFDESKLPRPGMPSQMEGFNPNTGVAIKMFVDQAFGAIHQSLFLFQYMPGARIGAHDHTFEESYYIVSGEVEAIADGQTYHLGAGSAIWIGVGCIHSFANVRSEPVRWIQSQAPLPPTQEVFRFDAEWQKRAQELGYQTA